MSRAARALEAFDSGCNCSQAVLSAFGPDLGLDPDTCLRVAGGFGGGMARLGKTCGAVTGAVMVLGFIDISGPDPEQAKESVYIRVRALFERFQARHGSTCCRDLIAYDLSTTEGLAAARTERVFTTRCPLFVRTAVEVLEDLTGGVSLLKRPV